MADFTTITLTAEDLEGHIRAVTDKYDDDFSIGSLSSEAIAKLLTNSAEALNKIYPTKGVFGDGGVIHTLYERVDSRGRYGAWRFTVQQLVDAGAVDQTIIPWAAQRLAASGDGPYVAERRSSWADEALKRFATENDDMTFASPRTEERNNIQFYLLANNPPAEIPFSKKMIRTSGVSPFASFVSSSEINQVYFAYEYLQFVYKMFVTARIVNELGPSQETIAGLLSVALCESYDAAINFSNNVIKTNTDGVSARYWYDIGWNSVAKTPLATTEASPVPDPAATAVTNVKSTATSEEPQEGSAAAVTSTTTDNGNPNAEPEKSDTPPATADSAQVAEAAEATSTEKNTEKYNSKTITENIISLTYSVSGAEGAKGAYSARVIEISNSRILAASTSSSIRENMKSELLSQIQSEQDKYQRDLESIASDVAAANPLLINFGNAELVYLWQGTSGTISIRYQGDTISSCSVTNTNLDETSVLQFLADVDSKIKTFTGEKKIDVTNAFDKLNVATFASVKNLYDVDEKSKYLNELLDSLAAINSSISSGFDTDTIPLENWRNVVATQPAATTETAEDGSTSVTQTQQFSDGSSTTVKVTENADGTVSKQKEVVPVAPPLEKKPDTNLEKEGNVPHPETDPGIASGPNHLSSNDAQNKPQNTTTANQKNQSKGFQDPNRTYPSKDHQNKPDTNPLAVGENSTHIQNSPKTPAGDKSGMSRGASPAARNATRKREVKMAGRNGATWSQPESPYAAQYPYNKVFGGESGHALEIDDTPGAERLNFAHRSGTYDETGPDGTKVSRIVGDGYTIYDKDGYILIEGQANVHVAGKCNVFIAGDTNLTMHGKASIDIHNDLDLNVGGHIAVTAGKGIFVRNQGIFSLDNVGDIEMRGKGNLTQEIVGAYNLTTTGGYNMTSKGDSHIKVVGVTYSTSKGDMNFCTEGVFKAKSTGDMNLKTGAVMKQESAGAFNTKSGAAINHEGTGNINLKAPLVASSPIDTSTIDVSTANVTTLNAGTTNLKGTHNSTDDTTNIRGTTTASVTAPASAVASVEADCAQAAPLSAPVPLEKPVSISRGASNNQSLADSGNAGTGANGTGPSSTGETPAMATDGSDNRDTSCVNGTDGSTSNNGDGVNDGSASPGGESVVGPYNPPPSGPYNKSPSGKTYALPTVTGKNIPQTLQLSDHYTVKDLMAGSYYKGYYQSVKHWGVQDILINLQSMANLVLEPLRLKYPGFTMTSGYRTYPYAPGNGASLSAHHIGCGIDFQWRGRNYKGMLEVGNWIAKNIAVDQVIYEAQSWIHIGLYAPSASGRKQRRQWFESDKNGNSIKGKIYNAGIRV
jgi:hypothetical protein